MQFPPTFTFGVKSAHLPGEVAPPSLTAAGFETLVGALQPGEEVAPERVITALKILDVDRYHLAVSWPQLQPAGSRELAGAPVRALRELLEELRGANIACQLTVSHGELPASWQENGGWTSRECAVAFAEFAGQLAGEVGELVDTWMTFSDPFTIAFGGYRGAEALTAAHHLNLAHGLAARAIRAAQSDSTRVGIALTLLVCDPDDEENIADVRAAEDVAMVANKIWLGPLLDATYPIELVTATREVSRWDFVRPGDLECCRARLDLLGVNYPGTLTIKHRLGAKAPSAFVGTHDWEFITADHGEIFHREARGLYDLMTALDTAYEGLELQVAAHGLSRSTTVDDADQVRYFTEQLSELAAAIEDGASVASYCLWSLAGRDSGIVSFAGEGMQLRAAGNFYRQLLADHREQATRWQQAQALEVAQARQRRRRRWFFRRR